MSELCSEGSSHLHRKGLTSILAGFILIARVTYSESPRGRFGLHLPARVLVASKRKHNGPLSLLPQSLPTHQDHLSQPLLTCSKMSLNTKRIADNLDVRGQVLGGL